MRVLMVHNFYQRQGGEDLSFAAERDLLRDHGHTVVTWRVHNRVIERAAKWRVAVGTVWSAHARRKLAERVRQHGIELVHFQNTFPLLSPSVYSAAREAGTAVVQSLRNFRLGCANGLLLRGGAVCETCIGRNVPWPAVRHRCYRGSAAASATVAAMQTFHRARGTWKNEVDRYIALNEFGRRKHVEIGLPAERIALKPNFLAPDPGEGTGEGGYVLFVGRLSAEKGVDTLLEAWSKLADPPVLKIVGDGPMREALAQAAAGQRRIEWLGHLPHERVLALAGEALALVVPSRWYEGGPRVLFEALARGTPVVCSDLGAFREQIVEGEVGLRFAPGDAAALAAKVAQLQHHPAARRRMRRAARRFYLAHFTAERNYQMLIAIYRAALAEATARRSASRSG
ncbi:MAG: glycosyltransferase [Phycisphaeraceae bacterium]